MRLLQWPSIHGFHDTSHLKVLAQPADFSRSTRFPFREASAPLPALRPEPHADTAHCAAMRRRCLGGFSLVEVVIALGLFAFAIIPLIGLMGGGLKISEDSIQSSNLSEIYRQAEARAVKYMNSNALPAVMYFNFSGGESSAADAIYQLSFTTNAPAGAAQGFLARKTWKFTVERANTTNIVGERFISLSQDPVDAFK